MANELFSPFKEQCLTSAGPNLDTADIRLVLIDAADDTLTSGVDEDLADLAAAARVATSGALASTTVAAGVFDSADVTLSSVSGDAS